MKLADLLRHVRSHHLDGLAPLYAPLVARPGTRVVSETVLLDDAGAPLTGGTLGLPMRVDAVVVADGAAPRRVQLDTGKMLEFPPVRFTWPTGPDVALGPFPWDALVMRLHGLGPTPGWEPVGAWFRQWFGSVDVVGDGGEPCGVVHHLAEPVAEGDVWVTVLDLGSAPVEAFEGLVNAVAAMGAARVELGGVG